MYLSLFSIIHRALHSKREISNTVKKANQYQTEMVPFPFISLNISGSVYQDMRIFTKTFSFDLELYLHVLYTSVLFHGWETEKTSITKTKGINVTVFQYINKTNLILNCHTNTQRFFLERPIQYERKRKSSFQ
jgi:hypothetical protein